MSTELKFKDSPEVQLINHQGDDASIVAAARVSVLGYDMMLKGEEAEYVGLINYLMKHRHGTPFEHNSVTFRISAPIFVFREWHRHRIGWSYNEESGRYRQLDPIFHLPASDRPLVNGGTSARPQMVPGSEQQYKAQVHRMKASYHQAYANYLDALEDGVAKEVAREVLPVAIFSTMYATANLRSIFNFLSLRIHDKGAQFISYPQYEIQQAAQQIEEITASLFPIAHAAFLKNGRVAP